MMMQGKVMGGGVYPILDMQMNGSSIDLMGHTVTDTAMTYDANNAIFNGTTSKIAVTDSNDLSFTDGYSDKPFTVDIKFTKNSSADLCFLQKLNEWTVYAQGNVLYLYFFDATLGGYRQRQLTYTFNTGTEYRLTILSTGVDANSGVSMYVNDTLQSTVNSANSGSYTCMRNTTNPLIVGMILAGIFQYNGKINYVRLYNGVYTPNQIPNV
jgi:hypothetical protein